MFRGVIRRVPSASTVRKYSTNLLLDKGIISGAWMGSSYNRTLEGVHRTCLQNRNALPAAQHLQIQSRSFSDQSHGSQSLPKRRMLPPLMSFPEIIWPSVFKSIRGFFFLHFIIRPYLDSEFNVRDFTIGAKQAVHVISTKLANSDWEGLKDFVSDDVLPELKESLAKMTVSQRSEIAIGKDDIYLTFPYQIGIIFDEEKIHRRIVEITMVFHAIRGLQEIYNRGEQIPMNLNNAPEHRDRITICNYRFRREFNKGEESGPWTVNLLNEFKPADLLLEDD